MKPKKIPLRMCLGCQAMKSKKELIRIVRSKEEDISVDFTGKKAGRGAYICRDTACLEKCRKTKRLERAFETAIAAEVYDVLKKELEAGDEQPKNA